MFPNEPAVNYIHEILTKCVVESESETKVHDANDLLVEFDNAIAAVSRGCQLPVSNAEMRCRFCGIGTYKKSTNYSIVGNTSTNHERNYFLCDHCGHLESFLWPRGKPPPGWIEKI